VSGSDGLRIVPTGTAPEQPARPGPLVARWALVVSLASGLMLGLGIAALVIPWGLKAG
jgi:hypothetical protein